MSESAFEAFKEKMRAAAAQIAAIKKEEQKHKKKEADLLKILLKFVKTSQKKELTLLISRCLEENIPAEFILAVILLGNEEIQKESEGFLMLKKGINSEENLSEEQNQQSENALVFFSQSDNQTLPLKIRIELDNWLKNLLVQAEEVPQKLIKTAYKVEFIELKKEYDFEDTKYEEKRTIKTILIQLIAYVLDDFMGQNGLNESREKMFNLAEFIIKGILIKIHENLESRKELK